MSHIDVFYDNTGGGGSFDLDAAANCPGNNSYADPGNGAVELRDTNSSTEPNQSTFAIDYAQGSPRSAVLIVIRNEEWTGTTDNCGIATLDLKIKRRRLSGTPPTLKLEDVRQINLANVASSGAGCPLNICLRWNGDFAVDETGFGRVNGTYELEVKLTSTSAENSLQTTLFYPGEGQLPIKVDVMDIHSIVSSPTVVGNIPAFPINVNYKLSKSGLVTLDIFKGSDDGCTSALDTTVGNNTTNIHSVTTPSCTQFVRRLINNQERWGEDTTQGKLGNVDTWDGRDTNGNLVSSGTYVFALSAWDPDSGDEATHAPSHDQAFRSTFSVTLDPMQIADLTVQPLTTQSTSFAGVSFILTEPATAYFDIWQTSATFADTNAAPPLTPNNGALLIRRIENTFQAKIPVSMIWDGRDSSGKFVEDGSYRFTLWAQEVKEPGSTPNSIVKTARAKVGTVPITRGLVPISQIGVTPGAFGNPAVTGVAPYIFGYSLGRDAKVRLKIIAQNGQYIGSQCSTPTCNNPNGCLVASLVQNETRSGIILHNDPAAGGWDGRTIGLGAGAVCANGIRISSGVYAVELNATDTLFTNRTSTITALFPVDLLRTANVATTALLSGTTDSATISYVFSEAMDMRWSVYPPTTTFTGSWPSLIPSQSAVRTIFGPRPGRVKITEFWDGRNDTGFFVPDGNYISVLTASDAYGGISTDEVIRELVVARGQIVILNPVVSPTFPGLTNSSATLRIPLSPYEVAYTLSRDANVTISIKTQDGVFITSLTNSEPRSGSIVNKEFWDGTNFTGIRISTGALFVDILAQDQASLTASSSVARMPLAVNQLRIYDAAVTPLIPGTENADISYQLSESMTADLRIYKPGTLFNAAGQPVPPESESLVFKVRGARPGRVGVSEPWPGINIFQKQVQDGNYVFRLIATDDQNVQASDVITGQISVLRLGFADPQSTFEDQTFAYPNPANQPVKICTLVPVDSHLNVKIFTLSGELVWSRELGFQAGGTHLCGATAINWNLDNNWGKRIARGIYFYVLRADSVGGDRQFLQTMKKILVQ